MAEEESAHTAESIQKRREREAEQWRQAQLKSVDAAEVNANFQARFWPGQLFHPPPPPLLCFPTPSGGWEPLTRCWVPG